MATETVILDCAHIKRPDIATIERLARSRLEARRRGLDLRLRNANAATLELVALMGLGRVLRLEAQREPEQRKQLRRVQEEGELTDPAV